MPRRSQSWAEVTSWCRRRGRYVVDRQRTRIFRYDGLTTNPEPHLKSPPCRRHQAVRQLHLYVRCFHADRVRHGHRPRPSPGHGPVSAATGHSARQSTVHSLGVRDVRRDRHSADVRDGLRSPLPQTQVTFCLLTLFPSGYKSPW